MLPTKLRLRNDRVSFGLTTVYVQYVYKSQNHFFSTGKKISPDTWNVRLQKVSGTSEEVKTLNAALTNQLATINRLIANADHHGISATPAYVREQLKALATGTTLAEEGNPVVTPPTPTLLPLFAEYIERTEATKAPGTVKHYRSTLNRLQAYAASRNTNLPLSSVDIRLLP